MAKGSGPAKRTNTGLALLAVAALLGSGAVAVFGDSASSVSSVSTLPGETPSDVVNPASGIRPAETSYTWFDHAFSAEQFDYEMNALSCASIAKVITPDLCGVAQNSHGHFMVVGSEGYWDKQDEDSDGNVWVPLNLTVFTLQKNNGVARAVSVLDGLLYKQFTPNQAQVDLYVATVGEQQMLVLQKRLSKKNADPYSFSEEVQVIAMPKDSAPTVVATYEGSQLRVAASANHIEISSLRYLTSSQSSETQWFTRIVLTPNYSDGVRMDETVTSGPLQVKQSTGMELLDTYMFPVGRGTVEMPDHSNKP
jgi:hypothetical protein